MSSEPKGGRGLWRDGGDGAKLHAPATERNREAILEVLERVLPSEGLVVELASGTGQHATFFASRLPGRRWQPTDVDPAALESIAAWREEGGCEGLLDPIRLDAEVDPWPVERADAVVAINLIHIAPWSTALAVLRGAASLLDEGGRLVLYGPYRIAGRHTAPSNEAFDASLRSRDPSWGVRDLEAVVEAATACGLEHLETVAMPANNQTVVFERRPTTEG